MSAGIFSRLREPWARRLWRDRRRALATLESFAHTEEDGGRDLAAAAERTTDAGLRRQLELHARDELRHAEMFRVQAAKLRAGIESSPDLESRPGRRTAVRVPPASHGFLGASAIDELGEVAYVAMLFVAEQRAASGFELHRRAAVEDRELREVFEAILADEKFHCSYTSKALDAWSAAGRGAEVREGLRAARRSRLVGAWRRLGLRSASGLTALVLYAFYWTIVPWFAPLARRGLGRDEWRAPRPRDVTEGPH